MLDTPKSKKRPNPIDIHVGTRIRLRRTLLSMSQEKLGDALGITFQQIQKYEKGTNRVGASRLQAIATTLNVPISFFFEGQAEDVVTDDTNWVENEITSFLGTSDGIALNRAFSKIRNTNLRRKVVSLVRAIAGIDDEPVAA